MAEMMAPNFSAPQARHPVYSPAMNDPADKRDDSDDKAPPTGVDDAQPSEQSLSLLQIVGSTMAAALGVQSSRNRERDFTRGKPLHFIIAGIVFTVLFVLTIVFVVNLVL